MRAKALILIGLAALIPSSIQAQSDKSPGDSSSGSPQATSSKSASSGPTSDPGKTKDVSAEPAAPAGTPYDPYPQIYGPETVESIVSAAPTKPANVPNPSPASGGVSYTRTLAVPNSAAGSAGVIYSRTAAVPDSTSAGVMYSRTVAVPDSASTGVTYTRTAAASNSSTVSAGVMFSRTADAANSSPVGVQSRFQKGYIADGFTADPSVNRDAHGKIQPSAAAKEAFQKEHPCPSSRNVGGSCPGYVVNHVRPLECGGADAPSNMRWQTAAAAKDAAPVYCR